MTTPTAERVRTHRQTLRAAGLRPVQIWAPDTLQPGSAAECRRQSRLVANGPAAGDEAALQSWLEPLAGTDGWY